MNKFINNKIVKIIRKEFQDFVNYFNNERFKVKAKNKFHAIFIIIIRAILIYGLAFVVLFPLFQQVTLALRSPVDLNNPTVIWVPEHWTLFNLTIAETMLDYWTALFDSLRLSFTVMVLQVFVTSIAGYAFARLKFRGSGLLFMIVVATILIPPQALSVSRYFYFGKFDILGIINAITGKPLNLLKSRYSLYLMSALGMGINSGLFIFIFRQFFKNIPKELDESAQVDGASVFRTFWSVMLPNARPAMLTVGLFSFVWQYNDIYYTNLLQISDKFELLSSNLNNSMSFIYNRLVMTGADRLVGGDITKNPFYFALVSNVAALLVMLPLLILFIFLQRYFVESIERTGIVG